MTARRRARSAAVVEAAFVPVVARFIRRDRVTCKFHCVECDEPLRGDLQVMCVDCAAKV